MSEFNLEKFGEKLKELRIKNNLSQEELGNKLFLSRQQISKYENGKSSPDIRLIYDICDIFKIETSELLDIDCYKKYKKNIIIYALCFSLLALSFVVELILFIIAKLNPISLGSFSTWIRWYKGFESVDSIIFLVFFYLNLILFFVTLIFLVVKFIYEKKK